MYKETKRLMLIADSGFSHFEKRVTDILKRYRQDADKAQGMYKETVVVSEKKKLADSARREIRSEADALSKKVNEVGGSLRKTIGGYLTAPYPVELVNILRDVHAFSLPVTEADIRAFVSMAGGNSLALRFINTVAASSGIRVELPDINGLSKCIDDLESFSSDTAMLFLPLTFSVEHGEVIGGGEFTNRAYHAQRYSAIRNSCHVDDNSAWTNLEKPKIVKIADDPVEYGRMRGKTQAEANERVRNVVKAYADGAPGTGGA